MICLVELPSVEGHIVSPCDALSYKYASLVYNSRAGIVAAVCRSWSEKMKVNETRDASSRETE